MLNCTTVLCLPACWFFPFGMVTAYLCFILLLKPELSCTWVLASSLSSCSLTERTSQMRIQQRMQPDNMGPGRKLLNIFQGDRSMEDYARDLIGVARQCIDLALSLSGSAFRMEFAPKPALFQEHTQSAPFREFTESAPEPAPFQEHTQSAPFREPTESAPEPAPFREPTESAPEPAPVRESTEPAPAREPSPAWEPSEPAPAREPSESTPVWEATEPAPEPAQWPPALPAPPWPPALPAPHWHPCLPIPPGPLPLHGPGPLLS